MAGRFVFKLLVDVGSKADDRQVSAGTIDNDFVASEWVTHGSGLGFWIHIRNGQSKRNRAHEGVRMSRRQTFFPTSTRSVRCTVRMTVNQTLLNFDAQQLPPSTVFGSLLAMSRKSNQPRFLKKIFRAGRISHDWRSDGQCSLRINRILFGGGAVGCFSQFEYSNHKIQPIDWQQHQQYI